MHNEQLVAEYAALTAGAGVRVVERSQVVMTGKDRATLLHKFCTQDVLGKTPGQGGEAFLCNVQGKIVAYVYFFVGEQQLVLDSAPGQAAAIIAHLDRYVITEDVRFRDAAASETTLLLSGEQAEAQLFQAGVTLPLGIYEHASIALGPTSASIRRVPLGGLHSWLLSVPSEQTDAVIAWLGEQGVTRCTAEAAEIVRIEAGSPLYGTDITVENLPQEVNRNDMAIHFRKGCYLGQETVARIDALGHVNKLLVTLKFAASAAPTPGLELKLGDKTVGRVTSCVYSPRHQAPLALAYVRREHSTPGTKLDGAEVVVTGS